MTNRVVQETQNYSVRQERFIRIVESRVNKVLDNLDNLGKCSNKRNYEYTDEEVRKVFREIDRKVKETKLLFQESHLRKRRFVLRK